MTIKVLKTIYGSDNRFLEEEEKQQILAYTSSMAERMEAAREAEAACGQAIKHAIGALRQAYPRFHTFHPDAWGKASRDLELIIRYQVQAMLLDDPAYLKDRVLVWLRTILSSFNFTPQFHRDTYTRLKEGVEKNVSPEAFRQLEPYMDLTIEVMSDFPEPAEPMV